MNEKAEDLDGCLICEGSDSVNGSDWPAEVAYLVALLLRSPAVGLGR